MVNHHDFVTESGLEAEPELQHSPAAATSLKGPTQPFPDTSGGSFANPSLNNWENLGELFSKIILRVDFT